uniref:Kringle-containing protein marking the eye and the nose n=1 Tax=Sarcophilus harrisii TaxID=9305 RepID=A0A7N4PCQ3_SARHA
MPPLRLGGGLSCSWGAWFWLLHKGTGKNCDPLQVPRIPEERLLPTLPRSGFPGSFQGPTTFQLLSPPQPCLPLAKVLPRRPSVSFVGERPSRPRRCPGVGTETPPVLGSQSLGAAEQWPEGREGSSEGSVSCFFFPLECFTVNGVDYRGRQNWTALHGGKTCLFWNETFQHPYNTLKYPHGEGGLGDHNYCRNPDGDVSPWCYVAEHEDGVYWKYCEIPACQMPGNLGCYRDHGNPPPLTGTSKTSNKLTIQNCISFCRGQKFKFAGMESGYACFCGNNPDYWKYGETASTECNSVCFGDHTQPCGGDGRIILFDSECARGRAALDRNGRAEPQGARPAAYRPLTVLRGLPAPLPRPALPLLLGARALPRKSASSPTPCTLPLLSRGSPEPNMTANSQVLGKGG